MHAEHRWALRERGWGGRVCLGTIVSDRTGRGGDSEESAGGDLPFSCLILQKNHTFCKMWSWKIIAHHTRAETIH